MALTDLLEDLKEDLEDSEDLIEDDPGPLEEPTQSVVAGKLTSAQGHITRVLSIINNVGAADTSNLPGTLPAIAVECVALARTAHGESLNTNPNNTTIGNKVKTINWIIDAPNGYRDKAGIT